VGSPVHRRRFLTAAASSLVLAACARGHGDDEDAGGVGGDRERRRAEPDRPTRPDGRVTPDVGRPTDEGPTEDPTEDDPTDEDPTEDPTDDDPTAPLPEPTEWGLTVTGVRTRLATDQPLVALTFDACGGPRGSGYDGTLVDGLLAAQVPATLFVNARWARANRDRLRQLAAEPSFELANHGTAHRPLSVTGRSAYGIAGTGSPQEVLAEVAGCQALLTEVTGRPPRHFRSGTAHYDEVAVRLVRQQGLDVVNFDVLGDAGATYTADQVTAALMTATPGSIVLLHMNQPGSGTARGVLDAIPRLRDRGLAFTTLGDHALV
jgi:peptidoglycan/xylan/chitin deacetylase (PgdA/CDA1 family)